MKEKLTKEQKKQLKAERKAKRNGIFAEFKKFISRGNIVDMAVGVIIAGAFTKIVNGFTQGVVMPFINWIVYKCVGDMQLSEITTVLNPVMKTVEVEAGVFEEVLDTSKSIIINWGTLIQAIIDFFLIALVLFAILKTFNYIKDKQAFIKEKLNRKEIEEKKAQEAKAAEEAKVKAAEELAAKVKQNEEKAQNASTNELLVEIIDLLKK